MVRRKQDPKNRATESKEMEVPHGGAARFISVDEPRLYTFFLAKTDRGVTDKGPRKMEGITSELTAKGAASAGPFRCWRRFRTN